MFSAGFFTASTVTCDDACNRQILYWSDNTLLLLPSQHRLTQLWFRKPVPSFEFTPVEIADIQPEKGIPTPAPTLSIKDSPSQDFLNNNGIEIAELSDEQIVACLRKLRSLDAIFASDIFPDSEYKTVLLETTRYLARVESYMGRDNPNLMSFGEMLRTGRSFSQIGRFEAMSWSSWRKHFLLTRIATDSLAGKSTSI